MEVLIGHELRTHSPAYFPYILAVFGTYEFIGYVNVPVRKRSFDGFEPFRKPRFARIDFLSSAHQANDGCPIRMAVHDSDKEFRFGKVESVLSLFPSHKIRSHLFRPCPLGFVENHDPVYRSPTVRQMFVPEMMDVLNEGFRFSFRIPFSDFLPVRTNPSRSVPSERLLQHFDQRSVSRKEHRVFTSDGITHPRGEIESDEGFSGSWNARNEADRFFPEFPGIFNDLSDLSRRHRKILDSSVGSGDFFYRMPVVQGLGRFDDGRSRFISRTQPCLMVQ